MVVAVACAGDGEFGYVSTVCTLRAEQRDPAPLAPPRGVVLQQEDVRPRLATHATS